MKYISHCNTVRSSHGADVARIDEELAVEVDRGVVRSKSEAVRWGLRELLERERRQTIGAAIVEGYRRIPQTGSEAGWTDDSARSMIAQVAVLPGQGRDYGVIDSSVKPPSMNNRGYWLPTGMQRGCDSFLRRSGSARQKDFSVSRTQATQRFRTPEPFCTGFDSDR